VRNELLSYYERELAFLRGMGAEFAKRYPKIAGRLQLESNRCEDPHVERLLEGSALVAARVHLRLDDDFPEISQTLLNLVYPHYTRPVPSMAVAEFNIESEKVKMTTGTRVPRDTTIYSKPVAGFPCPFRTCYDLELWPFSISAAQWRTPDRLDPPLRTLDAVAAIRIELACARDVRFPALALNRLRFYLNGEPGVVHAAYELLANNCTQIVLRDPRPKSRQRPVALPAGLLRPMGLAPDEAVLPWPRRSFIGYRTLQEYFAFPEKFLFFELNGLEAIRGGAFEDRLEIIFLLSSYERSDRNELLEQNLNARTFRLGCTPIVNLFDQLAEPILLDQTKAEYPIIPNVRRPEALEIFTIDHVTSTNQESKQTVEFMPLYSFRHEGGDRQTYYHAVRRDATSADDAGNTQMYLNVVDVSGRSLFFDRDVVSVRCTCSNGDLPSKLPFGVEEGDFEMGTPSPISRIVAIRRPSPTLRYPLSRGSVWRLISHLSLNYLSLVEDGRDALQEMLRLYQGAPGSAMDHQIDGITTIRSRRQFARLISEHGISHVRGMRVDMELDEDRFVGGGAFLFASVLEQFLAQYVSLNSFSQLSVTTRQRKEKLREWNPRAGNRILM